MIASSAVAARGGAARETRFLPSRVLESRVALEGGPGDWNIHQMHAVLPARPGRCRVLFRMSTDFVLLPGVARSVGGRVWSRWREMVRPSSWRRRAGGGDAGQAAERYRSWMREVSPD